MTYRLMTSAAIVALVCATALSGVAFAEDAVTGDAPGSELIDPAPGAGGEDIGGEVVIDDGVMQDGDGEVIVEDGEAVPYGPDDCIDCNVAPTMVDLGGRPEGENFRGDAEGPVNADGKRLLGDIARVDTKGALCDIGDVANIAKVCP